jgi:hypothetical protein
MLAAGCTSIRGGKPEEQCGHHRGAGHNNCFPLGGGAEGTGEEMTL